MVRYGERECENTEYQRETSSPPDGLAADP